MLMTVLFYIIVVCFALALIGWSARAQADGRPLRFVKGIIGCYWYRDPIRRGIHRMKFSGAKNSALLFGDEMAQQVKRSFFLVPV